MIENMDIGANMPAVASGDKTERFSVKGARSADGFLEEARKNDFKVLLAGKVGLDRLERQRS